MIFLSKIMALNIPIEILGEILCQSNLVGGVRMYMTCSIYYNNFSIEYSKYSNLLVYILKKIKGIQGKPFAQVRRIFEHPLDFIKKYNDNHKIIGKIVKLDYTNQLRDEGFNIVNPTSHIEFVDVDNHFRAQHITIYELSDNDRLKVENILQDKDLKHCSISSKHIRYLSDDCFIKLINKKEFVWNIYLWRHMRYKFPDKDFRNIINTLMFYDESSHIHIRIVSYLGYEDLIPQNILCFHILIYSNILLGSAEGGHLNLFQNTFPKFDFRSMPESYEAQIISGVFRGGNIGILKIICNYVSLNILNNFIPIAFVHNNYDIINYLIGLQPDKVFQNISLYFTLTVPNVSVYDCIMLYIDTNVFNFMPIKILCRNGDRKSVNLLLSYGYIDSSNLSECRCGHKYIL
jgi:hypothetical protein